MAAATRKTVTFVTGNENKLREVRAILGEDAPFALEARAVDLPELQGESADIAVEKVTTVQRAHRTARHTTCYRKDPHPSPPP